MRSFKTFSMILVVNCFLSMIGVFTVIGPLLGFPLILAYTFGILFLGTKSIIKNVLYSFLALIITICICINLFSMLALGIMYHMLGIIAGIVFSSYIVSKEV